MDSSVSRDFEKELGEFYEKLNEYGEGEHEDQYFACAFSEINCLASLNTNSYIDSQQYNKKNVYHLNKLDCKCFLKVFILKIKLNLIILMFVRIIQQ